MRAPARLGPAAADDAAVPHREQQVHIGTRELHDHVGSFEIIFGGTGVGDLIFEVEASFAKHGLEK